MALLPPFFLNCVVAIGSRVSDTQIAYNATGFLFAKLTGPHDDPKQRKYNAYLVTNRHVFEGLKAVVLRFNTSGGATARTYDLALVDGKDQPLWSVHPRPEVDVAAMPIFTNRLTEDGVDFNCFLSDQHSLSLADATKDGVSEGDGIYVLGFPLGDVGKERNYVIVRHGTIARMRDVVAGATDYLMIDATIFPGNSGGPVVTQPEAMAIAGTKGLDRSCLIGMISAYVPYTDVAYSKQTGRARVSFEENTGLALVVPVDHIADVVTRAHDRMVTEDASKQKA